VFVVGEEGGSTVAHVRDVTLGAVIGTRSGPERAQKGERIVTNGARRSSWIGARVRVAGADWRTDEHGIGRHEAYCIDAKPPLGTSSRRARLDSCSWSRAPLGRLRLLAMPKRKDSGRACARRSRSRRVPGASSEKIEDLITRNSRQRLAENSKIDKIESNTRSASTVVTITLVKR